MPNTPTASEQWFDEYLATHRYRFEIEPDLGVATRPDRVIERAGDAAICEIKEFTMDAMLRRWPTGGSQFGSFGADEWFLNVRRTIGNAARQLEPLAGDRRPLVIVLANPHQTAVPIGDGHELIQAMYGNLQITFQISTQTGAAVTEPAWEIGDGGRLAEVPAPWVSAVAALRRHDRRAAWNREWIAQWKAEHWPDPPRTTEEAFELWQAYTPELQQAATNAPSGYDYYIELVETISEEAVSVSHTIFDGERDIRWIVNRGESRYERRL